MPKALADFLGLVFFFWSNESGSKGLEPIHVHVSKGQPTVNATKIWIHPDGILEVEHNGSQLSEKELKKALEYIKVNRARIIARWYDFFDGQM